MNVPDSFTMQVQQNSNATLETAVNTGKIYSLRITRPGSEHVYVTTKVSRLDTSTVRFNIVGIAELSDVKKLLMQIGSKG